MSEPVQPAVGRPPWLVPALVALAAGLPYLLVNDLPGPDAGHFYLPMARAFAAGRWDAAFFPMIPPLFPIVAGAIAWTGVPVLTAGRIVSLGSLVLAVPLAYALFRRLHDARVARVACWLVAVHPLLIRYAGNAGVDTLKMLLVLLLVYTIAAWLHNRRWYWMAAAGAACGLATLARSESPVFAAVIGAVPLWTIWREGGGPAWKRLARAVLPGLVAAVVMFLTLLPWIFWQRAHTGYWITDTRQLLIAAKLHLVTPEEARNAFVRPPPADEELVRLSTGRSRYVWVNGTLAGIGYHVLLLLAAWWWFSFRPRRRWTVADTALIACFLLNIAAFATSGLVTKRYVSMLTPLLFGWAAIGYLALYDLAAGRYRAGFRWLVIIVAAICVWDGTNGARPSLNPNKRASRELPRAIGAAIRADADELPPRPPPPSTLQAYHNGLRPVVLASTPEAAFVARADHVILALNYVHSHRDLLRICDEEQVDYLVVDPDFLTRVAEPELLLADRSRFQLLETWPIKRRPSRLYRYLGPPDSSP